MELSKVGFIEEQSDALKKSKRKVKIKNGFRLSLTHLVIIIGCMFTVIPLLWMVSTSLKLPGSIFRLPPDFIPNPVTIEHYVTAVTEIPFAKYFVNTTIIAVIRVVGEVLVSALVAYGFTRFNFRFRNQLFFILLATLMIPGEVTMIPSYIMYSKLSLVNTYFPIAWAAFLGGSATYIFFLRMFFQSIPRELDESAYMDGANSWQIFWKILVPISKPAFVTIGIWSFMGAWNDLLGPLLYLNDYNKYTLQLGLAQFNSMKEINWGALMAASVLALLPPLIIFFFGQKKLVDGIKMTGIKG